MTDATHNPGPGNSPCPERSPDDRAAANEALVKACQSVDGLWVTTGYDDYEPVGALDAAEFLPRLNYSVLTL